MATVPDAFGFGAERGDEPLRDQRAIRVSPAHGQVVTAEIFRRGERICSTPLPMFIHVIAQHRFAQSARTAVNEHDQLLLPEPKLLELVGVENFLDRLQFGEVIAAADGAERGIELRGFEDRVQRGSR